ncbi:MAG: type 2 lanthipeptide synthetase LanM family protein [Bryobacteraceae bacterium]
MSDPTPEFWANLVERASWFAERIGPDFVPRRAEDCPARDRQEGERRLQRWMARTAAGDREQFRRRLQWDGLDEDQAWAIATSVRFEGRDLPAWTSPLRDALAEAKTFRSRSLDEAASQRFLDPADPIAFEHVIAPIVIAARKRLQAAAGKDYGGAREKAHAALERYLAQWLCAVSAESIELNFTAFRSLRQTIRLTLPGFAPERRLYGEFIDSLYAGGLGDLFSEYAVMARLLGRIVELWVEFAAGFLRHISEDAADLEAAFAESGPLGAAVEVMPGLSDRHDGGRTSLRVIFENGLPLIYKPKDLESETIWRELLQWINSNGSPLDMPVFRSVCRPDHGWVEIVEHLPCETSDAVSRYYRRAGMLLCLVYALEGSDCHHENIIASGEYPVLIDMETLMQHRVRMVGESQQEDASSLANRVFYWDSVFRTALLPRWEFGPGGESYDISGLGGVESQKTSFTRKAWKHINTDGMRLWREKMETRPHSNVVYLDGRRVDPATKLPEILSGFEEMYRYLMGRRETLFAPGGPLERLHGLRLRFLFRHTKIYTSLLGAYLRPQFLSDGMDAFICIDVLARPLLHTAGRHPFWEIVAAEEAALAQADIPIFHAVANSTALHTEGGGAIEDFFAEPSYELLRVRFGKMGEQDLRTQLSYIRSSFSTPETRTTASAVDDDRPLSAADFVEEARAIARNIRECAIDSPDGSATWISLAYYAEAQRWQLQPMTPRLYDGAGGAVLFLAAMEHLYPGEGNEAAARSGIRALVHAFDTPTGERLLLEAGVGAGLGAASVSYCLARAGQLLWDESLVDAALDGARKLLTEERLAADRRYDLLGGAAGAIVTLLAIHGVRPEGWLLERADCCGQHLLRGRVPSAAGPRTWPTLSGELLTGFSHGAAGIAHALALLGAITGNQEYAEAARESIGYEESVWDESARNWPDFRFPKTSKGWVYQVSWCHGAPGIGLGRLGSLPRMDAPETRRDIERALETTSNETFGSLDHLCCGNLGRAETLLVAASTLGRPEYAEHARLLAQHVVNRARRLGQYQLGWNAGPYIPSFHQGMAGIGYQLLRLAHPGRLPSILLWE